jgi:hypothetical protein
MKKLTLSFLLISVASFAQTTTDSISTPLGDFVLISEEEIEESTGYLDETSTTSDGGTAQLLELSSGARLAQPMSEVTTVMTITMMPNPTAGIVEMYIKDASGSISISVKDVLGQTVYETSLICDGSRTAYLPAQTWASGTYIVNVRGTSSTLTERLVVR